MVSNQLVTRSLGITSGFAAGLALLLAGGCRTLAEPSAPAAAPPAPLVRSSVPVQEENAVEAALARMPPPGTAPAPAAAAAPAPVLNPTAPASYVVKRGDTLWDISAMFLRDPWLWPEIWHVNPAVANPHLIYPGDTLKLVYGTAGSGNGMPEIQLIPGDAVRVSPMVRSRPLDGAIATIPYQAIAAFLGRPGLLSEEEVARAPKIAAVRDNHLVGSLGNSVYVKGMKSYAPGRYSIVRVGEQLKDPETGSVLGYIASYAASASVDTTGDPLTKAVLVDSVREAVEGDVVFAAEVQAPGNDIVPRAPPPNFSGQIMAVVDGVTQIGQYNIVAVNRGTKQGLEVGHVLAIDQKGAVVADGSCKTIGNTFGKKSCHANIKLPDERAGTLLIFKTYERMSYALVIETVVPVRVADVVRTP
jgi:hypothetical protein